MESGEQEEVLTRKRLVLDANILLRGVFGKRVPDLFRAHSYRVDFYVPEVCLAQALKYLPEIASRKKVPMAVASNSYERITNFIDVVEQSDYEVHEETALWRLAARDASDWPVLATALLLDCPIWTEDHDFFGTGVPTWTTATIEHYLGDSDIPSLLQR